MDLNENMDMVGKRHLFQCNYTVGMNQNGKITALELNYYTNGGWTLDASVGTMNMALNSTTGRLTMKGTTGASAITLKLPGEDRLMGRGVGTCAVCDAPFYKGKDTVFIIGGGDSAIEEAMEISKFASNVIVLVRKESMRASPILQKRIKSAQNIKIWYKSQAVEFIGDKKLEKVKVNKDGIIAEFPADGLFYAIGHSPATKWLEGSGVKLDENGYIITNNQQLITNNYLPTSTSLPGIFAAGDCVDFRYRQAIVAAGFGAMAALDAQKWLENFLP